MTLADALTVPPVEPRPVNFGILADDGTVLFVNSAWREFGQDIFSAIRPADEGSNYLEVTQQAGSKAALTIAGVLDRMVAGGDESGEARYLYQTRCGERQFLMRAHEFLLDDRRYIAVAHLDITDRERRAHDIAGFRQAVEAAGHAIFITDADGEITYVNPAFERITGYSSAEALGQTPRILKSAEMGEEYYDRLWETILAGRVWDELVINRRKSGNLYYAHQTIAPVLDNDGNPIEFVAIQTDITELQVTRAGTEKLGTLLRHDLRNELNVVQSYAELIEQRDGEVAEYAAQIVRTVSDLLKTTEKGIQLQKFLSTAHQPSPTDISDIVRTVASRARVEHPDADIIVSVEDGVVAQCLSEIEVALGEFIENSIVHNDSDTPRVELSVEETEKWVEIRTADDGPGTPPMEYEALDSATTELYHDTGFGLNLAYWIVRRSGGNLTFTENDPDGTVVTVRLPTHSH